MKRPLANIFLGIALCALGIVGGFLAARQGTADAHEGDEHDGAEARVFGDRTLANLGVEVAPVSPRTFVRTLRVQATVVEPPLARRPLVAPLGGIVTEVAVRPGQAVEPGAVLMRYVREPIARPDLHFTADLLSPVGEKVHESIAAYRTAHAELGIAEAELARIRAINQRAGGEGLPIVPRTREIELEYEHARARERLAIAERELAWHGLAVDELDDVLARGHEHRAAQFWRRSLEHNGLWDDHAEAILAALPEAQRAKPWTTAVIGELIADGLGTPELAAALREEPALVARFLEAAGLLQQGHPLRAVTLLARLGALEENVVLRAPEGLWDVAQVDVRAGTRVAAGEALCVLHDPGLMWLRLAPVGDEVAAVQRALADGDEIAARPLVAGSGPHLEGLRIERLETDSERGAVAIVACANEELARRDGLRSWKLRTGLRYVVDVPVERLEERFVLPAGAVAHDGPDRVVYRRDGEGFVGVPVHVVYEDERVAVVAHDGALFPGDPIAVSGAFGLQLAMQAESGAADPHAGHAH